MRKTLIALSAALSVAFAPGALGAEAAPSKKKAQPPVAAKKEPVKQVRKVKQARQAKPRQRQIVSREDAEVNLLLKSAAVMVQDQSSGALLFEKNADAVVPIASITKLMTAMVVLDARLGLSEVLSIGEEDVDTLKGTHSRLKVGTRLTREEMLLLALMSSENRAASALGRHYPGGRPAFIAAMNAKALELGLTDTHFEDSTGLTAANVSSARDLAKLVDAAHQYPLIREYSTTPEYHVTVAGRPQVFRNTNALVKSPTWDIGLSKTGFISEAGKCLVMQAWMNNKPVIIVLLDSWGKLTRIGDANRIKRWVESAKLAQDSTSG